MLSYKKYKKIYTTSTFLGYIWNHLLYKPRRWARIPYCTYMCIKYPFLYPRNRFTGLHYNNWRVLDFAANIAKKYNVGYVQNDEHGIRNDENGNIFYYERNGRVISYWKTWWSKPLHRVIMFFHDYILQVLFCLPTYTEWDAMEDGWDKAFGKQYLDELKTQLKKDKMLYSWRITQLKEKFGECRLYCNFGSDELYNIISKYEDVSRKTCIKCGKPATHTSVGWISPYCEECVKRDENGRYLTFKEYDNQLKSNNYGDYTNKN
jgi:hypothetical protein